MDRTPSSERGTVLVVDSPFEAVIGLAYPLEAAQYDASWTTPIDEVTTEFVRLASYVADADRLVELVVTNRLRRHLAYLVEPARVSALSVSQSPLPPVARSPTPSLPSPVSRAVASWLPTPASSSQSNPPPPSTPTISVSLPMTNPQRSNFAPAQAPAPAPAPAPATATATATAKAPRTAAGPAAAPAAAPAPVDPPSLSSALEVTLSSHIASATSHPGRPTGQGSRTPLITRIDRNLYVRYES